MSVEFIIPSSNKKKKITAIFYNEEGKKSKTVHFGQSNANDYTIYYKEDGKKKADERKRLYYARHSKEDWTKAETAGTLSKYILWFKPTIEQGIKAYLKEFKLKLK